MNGLPSTPQIAIPLVGPNTLKGFASSPSALGLPPSFAALIRNARLTGGVLRVRDGDRTINLSIGPGTIRGAYACKLNGAQYLLAAIGDGSKVIVYASTDEGGSWGSITPTTGPYGDTRLMDSSTSPVRFHVVKDRPPSGRTAYDVLVIQNGVDMARMYAKGTSDSTAFTPGAYGMAVVYTPPAMTQDQNFVQFTGFDNYFIIDDPTGTTFTNTDATKLKMLDSGVGSPNYIIMTLYAIYTAGNTTTVSFTTPVNFSQAKQFVMMADSSADTDFWSKMRVTLTDNSAQTKVIYDPSSGRGNVTLLNRSELPSTWLVKQIAYDMDGGASTTFDLTAVKKVTFEWMAAAPVADITANIFMMAAGGKFAGGTIGALSYASADSRQEGASLIYGTVITGAVSSSGGTASGAVPNIADDPRFYYDYHFFASNTSNAARDAGIDRVYLYVELPGQTDFYQIATKKIARWTGAAWAFQGGTAGQPMNAITTSDMYALQDFSKNALGGDSLCLMPGTAMATAQGRFFTTDAASRFYYSQYERPFAFKFSVRFFDAQTPDPLSAGSFALDGETIQNIVALGSVSGLAETNAPLVNLGTLYILSDSNLWRLSGSDALSLNRPQPVGPYGTLSPMSVARCGSGFFWLDQRGQIRELVQGEAVARSVSIVDDKTTAIPAARKVWAWGAYYNERYHLGYTRPANTANDRCLVWSTRLGSWESDDTLGSSRLFQALVPFYSSANGYMSLYGFYENVAGPSAGACFAYSESGSVNSSLLQITMGEFSPVVGAKSTLSDDQQLVVRKMSAMVDLSSGSVTLTGLASEPATGQVSSNMTISTTVGGSDTRRWLISAAVSSSPAGRTIQPSLSGTLAGGSRLYSWAMHVETRTTGASFT